MTHLSDDNRRRAFADWLRRGRLPPMRLEDGLELKFNPWHDPENGRFTFSGSGRQFGAGAVTRTGAGERMSGAVKRRAPAKLPIGATSVSEARRAGRLAVENHPPVFRDGAKRPQQQRFTTSVPRPVNRPGPTVEFARGAAEGLYDTAAGTAKAAYSVLTTNPITTARNAGRAIAGTIDTVVASEDVPARIQISRAASAVANASAHDLGRATGSVAGNVALSAAPGAALSKVSALRRFGAAGPLRATYDPVQVGWVKENLGKASPAKLYNDTAPGARPNQAPTLMRAMPDGSKRPVKFDGVQGEYLIDRKLSVSTRPRAVAQIMRQSEVLAQHHLIGVWEVPDQTQRIKAIKILKKMNVTNIRTKVVKP